MTNLINQKKLDDQNRFNQVAAAVTGAVVGAGIGVAGAVVMSDKNNREKMGKVFIGVRDQAVGYVTNIQKNAEDKKEVIKKEFAKDEKKVQKVIKIAKKSLGKTVKDVKKAAK